MKMLWCVISVLFVMLFIPYAAAMLIPPDASLVAFLMLFYIINPLFSVFMGIVAGKKIRKMWWISLLVPVSFIFSGLLLFKMGTDVLMFSAAYFVLCLVPMIITSIVKYDKDRKA